MISAKQKWLAEKVLCNMCKSLVSKRHLSKHKKSKDHLRMLSYGGERFYCDTSCKEVLGRCNNHTISEVRQVNLRKKVRLTLACLLAIVIVLVSAFPLALPSPHSYFTRMIQ